MPEPLIHAADRLDQAEDQIGELIAWLKDITDDLIFLATINQHLLESAECLPNLLRPMTVPATEQHRQLTHLLHQTEAARRLWNLRVGLAQEATTERPPAEPGESSPTTPGSSPDSLRPPQEQTTNCEPCKSSHSS